MRLGSFFVSTNVDKMNPIFFDRIGKFVKIALVFKIN